MCGIFGYVGNKDAALILIKGLKKLEYRGYDSAGIYISGYGSIKSVGHVKNLEDKVSKNIPSGSVGIAHTRWATHGKPTEVNAHPHTGNSERIWLVHNGVIENHKELKEKLIKNRNHFKSETDTEVVVHLIESFLPKFPILQALQKTITLLKGSYALAIIDSEDPQSIYVVRKGSPLVVGVGQNELFISSDSVPLREYTNKIIYLNDGEIGILNKDRYKFVNEFGKPIRKPISQNTSETATSDKGTYKHFMLKEIMEQPEVIERVLLKIEELKSLKNTFKKIKKIIIVGCGTAYYSGIIGTYYFEEHLCIPTEVETASEFRYRNPVITQDTMVIAMSQSGETADTLEAIRYAKKAGAYTLGIINSIGSTMSREVDLCIYNDAGSEIGVASTKAFVSQVTMLLAMGCTVSENIENKIILKELKLLPKEVRTILAASKKIQVVAQKYSSYRNFLYLGRKYQYAIALEGALKLKEISYIHAEGYGSGEMKHGPLAMIDEDFPSVVIALKDTLYEKNISTIQEIKARNGKVIAIATESDKDIVSLVDDVIYIPVSHEVTAAILSVISLQLFAYYIADHKALNIDKPRNLAKSVTVE